MHYLVLRLLGRCYVGDFGYIAGEWVTNTKSGWHLPNTGELEGVHSSVTSCVV